LITRSMEAYPPPLHLWLSLALTRWTGDPNIAGHWVHLIMLLLTLGFIFALVRHLAGNITGMFSVFFYLHTRNLVQRMTCGVPRGWAGPVLAAFLYFLCTKNHWGVILTLFFGTLLHPPSAFMCAATYGLYLFVGVLWNRTRLEFMPNFARYLVVAPIIAFVAFVTVQRSPDIGSMVTYEQAKRIPALQRHGGRFPFVPMKDAFFELNTVGIQAFVNRWEPEEIWVRRNMTPLLYGFFCVLLLIQWRTRRELFPPELLVYVISIFIVYFLSRELAYRLYVPDRHLQFPLNTFFIVAFPVAIWRLFHPLTLTGGFRQTEWRYALRPSVALLYLGVFIFWTAGSGLEGQANFNYRMDTRPGLYSYVRTTPLTSMFASHPGRIDPLQLLGQRKAYVTTETAHPFYDAYYKTIQERLQVVFRAFYAGSLEELLATVEPARIDYFVYFYEDFLPEKMAKASYTQPFRKWVNRLAQKYPRDQYVGVRYASVPPEGEYPFVAYRDGECFVVDIAKLREYLNASADAKPQDGK
ncbi:MAG: hypothetical protein IT290_06980, partial [Deltaproteobacteria bacterium]|nr:hypothetical protein [Deltaproteobacteria bacterium]